MMYFYLLLSTAQAFPMVDVTGCRETEATRKFDESIDKVMKNLEGLFKITNFDKIMPDAGKISIRKMIYDLGDHARPLLFERVECKDGPGPDDFQPCRDMYGETVCEQVALRKKQEKSTCKAIDRLDATGVSVAPRGDVAMTCNMEDSLESMELYVKGMINKTPECPEGLRLEDPKMKKAKYDKEKKTFTLSSWSWSTGSTSEDVTDKVKCIRKPRKEVAQAVKEDLVSQLDIASKFAPAPYKDHAQKLEEELENMTPKQILVHYDALMNDPVTKTAEIMKSKIAKDIMKDVGKTTIDIVTDQAKDQANAALDMAAGLDVVQQNQDLKNFVEFGKNNINVVEQAANDLLKGGLDWFKW